MRKIFFPLVMMICILTGCGGKLLETEKIIIGIDDEYAPMSFRNEREELVGFEVDLAKEVAKRLGVEVGFKPIDWSKKEEELNSGQIDMIWSGFDITPERQEIMLFSKPYMDNRQIVFIKRGEDLDIISAADLADKIVGTQRASTAEDYIKADEELINSLRDFKTYPTYKNALNALDDGEIDALICDEIVGRYADSKQGDIFDALDVTIGSFTQIGIGFRKDDTKLRDRIQAAFDDVVKDGTAKKISEQWFGADLIRYRR